MSLQRPERPASSPAVAVLGGRGFLGSVVVAQLARMGIPVVSMDRVPPAGLTNSCPSIVEVEADVLGSDWWPAVMGCDVLINLIGTGDHPGSQERPHQDLLQNCATAIAALEGVDAAKIHRVAYASTRQVYGTPRSLPVGETQPAHPIDVNGVHRYAAECYHTVYARRCGIAYTVIRFTNLYGPSMRADAPMFLARWLDRACRGEPFEVWGGTQIRDLLYVDDAARGLIAALPHCSPTGSVFNCGGAEPMALVDIAARLGRLGLPHRVVPYPASRAAIEIGDFVTDSSLLTATTGWTPDVTLDEGLRRTVQAAGLFSQDDESDSCSMTALN